MREGRTTLCAEVLLFAILLFAYFLSHRLFILWGNVTLFIIMCASVFFFRDPERRDPVELDCIVSPADGTIHAIRHAVSSKKKSE